MLLFQKRFHEGLKSGAVRLTFRRWQKPHVRPGGRYRCHPIGVLEVDQISLVRVSDLTVADAVLCGFEDRATLIAYLSEVPGEVLLETTELFRVDLHFGGDGDRVESALEANLSADDIAMLIGKLAKMDASSDAPWTRATLSLIAAKPKIAASKLALELGRETARFKADVVKLKKLGLTQSFEVGYEISPRGRTLMAALPAQKRKTSRART